MKNSLRFFLKFETWLAAGLLLVLVAASYFGFAPAQQTGKNFWMFFSEMMVFMPLLFVVVGLSDVWFPKHYVEKHIGPQTGVMGAFWVILLASFQIGPLYGAFPVACLLWKKGCSVRNVFIYLGAFSSVKIPMLTFEIGFLGLKFSLLRAGLSLAVFIVIAFVMDFYLRDKDFKIQAEA